METTPAVVGFGNPLLDITVNVSADYLAKFVFFIYIVFVFRFLNICLCF